MNVYEMVTERILSQLNKGNIPWHKPWVSNNKAFNRVTKKTYSLINQLLLPDNGEYASAKQWFSLGGSIKKGEKGHIVVFWKMLEVEEKQQDGTLKTKTVPILRYYTVFHISQVNGVEPLEPSVRKENNPIEDAERLIDFYKDRENINISVVKESDKAFYSIKKDSITVPERNQFISSEAYYDTVFHEMVHSTGAETRLNRALASKEKIESYAKEELVAEIGAAMLNNMLGIDNANLLENNAAYINSWKERIANDTKLIVSASSLSEKAVKYIIKDSFLDEKLADTEDTEVLKDETKVAS